MPMLTTLLKSILHNIGVVIVRLGVGLLGTKIDALLGIGDFHSIVPVAGGWLLVAVGFVVRL
jgi:hypothetical protein